MRQHGFLVRELITTIRRSRTNRVAFGDPPSGSEKKTVEAEKTDEQSSNMESVQRVPVVYGL